MFQLSYDDIVNNIVSEKKLSRAEVEEKVKNKLDSLSNLISKEGAAHIIANELGLNLFDTYMKKEYKIHEIKTGMRNLNFSARVLKIYGVNTFKKETREGKVGSLFVGDETGKIRVVLWDNAHLAFLEQAMVKEGDVIRVRNAYTKENNRGFSEAHLGSNATFEVNPEGITIDVSESTTSKQFILKDIASLQEGEMAEVRGTIRAVYPLRFYEACPDCNKKVQEGTCSQHGNVHAKKTIIANFLFDDGTETIRVVAFRNNAEMLFGEGGEQLAILPAEELQKRAENIAGEQMKISGKVSKNQFTGKLELSVIAIEKLNPDDLARELMQEVKVSEI